MHVPSHPFWFWLFLSTPFVVWLSLWLVAHLADASLEPLGRWLKWSSVLLMPTFVLLDAGESHKLLRSVVSILFYTSWTVGLWITRRYQVETLAMASRKLYFPWQYAEFTIPCTLRIRVRDVNSVTPWYKEKLGLHESTTLLQQPNSAAYQFKNDGNFIVFTTREGLGTEKTPIFFTKKIDRMWRVLSARGLQPGTVEQDRQGTRYFKIRDPEGNVIEVVEEPKL